MRISLRTEFYKYRVPLSQAWEAVTDLLVARAEQAEVETLIMERLECVDAQIQSPDIVFTTSADDVDFFTAARASAIETVQARFSGSIPDLADRETDILTQHYLIWSLIGKLLHKGGVDNSVVFRNWVISHSMRVLSLPVDSPSWRARSKDILNALNCLKGMVNDELAILCESFLSEKDLALPSIGLITKKTNRFKQIMSSPNITQELPRLLTRLTNDKEFRQVFVWLPLDTELEVSPDDFRYLLSIIVRILFGKLSQRGGGIDKRSSFAERQKQIMGYIGTVPVEHMDVVFSIFFVRVITTNISCTLPVFNQNALRSNPKLCLGLLSLMQKMVSQMMRKIDPFVPTLVALVVEMLLLYDEVNTTSSDTAETWNLQISKLCFLRLKEMMTVYSSCKIPWSNLLTPILPNLQFRLSRSSCVEASTVFQMVTSWSFHEELVPLFSQLAALTETLFAPRAYVGRAAAVLFASILALCGETPTLEKQRGSDYLHARKQLLRTFEDSDASEDEEIEKLNEEENFNAKKIALNHAEQILATVSLSLAKSSLDVSLHLKVTMALLRNFASTQIALPTCLLPLLGNLVAPLTLTKKRVSSSKQAAIELFGAIEALVTKSDCEIPPLLLTQITRPIVTLDDVLGRLVLARCVYAVERTSAAKQLVELNSVKSNSASVQPDVDKHIDVLQELVDSGDKNQIGCLIRHCLFLVSLEACDSTVRHLAERYLCMQTCVPDGTPGLLLMILNTVHRLLQTPAPSCFRSGLKILIHFVRVHSSAMLDDNKRLFHQDLLPHTELLEELLHIQKQKRTRGFRKLIDQELSEYTKQKLVLPIALEMIGQADTAKSNYDQGMSDVGIAAICVCGNKIQILLTLMKVLLRKLPEREKFVFKAVGKVTEFIRLNNEEVDLEKINSVLIPQLKRRIWDAKGNLKTVETVDRRSKKDSSENEGMVKLDVVVALLEVLKLLPLPDFEAAMPQIVSLICRGLPSREILCRKAARESLRRCGKIMGVGKIAWLLKQIRLAVPKGGYQAAVAVFTAHAVFEAIAPESVPVKTSIEIAEELLEFLRIEDRQWANLQTRSPSDLGEEAVLSNQCLEAGRLRGHELVELGGKFLAPEIVVSVLLQSVYGFFTSLDVDIAVSDGEEPEEKSEVTFLSKKNSKKFAQKSDDSDSSEAESGKRKIEKISSKRDVQLNSCFGKKFFSRIEGAMNSIVSGIAANSRFTTETRLAVTLQAFAVFNEFLAHRSATVNSFESDLFTSVAVPARVFEIDHEESIEPAAKISAKKSRAEILKENTFIVQPGASTGKGHWVTEEWKQGKMNTRNGPSEVGANIRSAKMKLLATLALRIVNQQVNDLPLIEAKVGTLLGKFLTRSLCSGISELFQLSAKAISRVVATNFFNERALAMIMRKLIASFEQMHANGSDLSFITLKAQRKVQAAEMAATCSSLLLALTTTMVLQPDMLDALAAHVLVSLDNPGLQWSSLLILRKVLLVKKNSKSAVLYDCLNKVGELVSTASSEKIAAVSGTMYGRFLVEFPHTENSLLAKVTLLLKQAQFGSILSRKTALNTIFSFVKALSGRLVQDVFGELIVVTLSVRIAMEEDVAAAGMIAEVVELCLAKFLDAQRRLTICQTIANWAKTMTKWQFVFASMQIATRIFAHRNWVSIASCTEIVNSVVGQIPFLAEQGEGVETRGLVSVVHAVGCLTAVSVDSNSAQSMSSLLQLVATDLLSAKDPTVTGEALRQIHEITQRPEAAALWFTETSVAPWPLMMRVLHLLCSEVVESHLELASVAMKSIANLLPLTYGQTPEIHTDGMQEEHDESMGLFKPVRCALDEEVSFSGKCEFDRLAALLKKIRYEVRKLMARSRDSVIRLASLLKLTTALTLGCMATTEGEILPICLEILIRLATINKSAEEVSIELDKKNINSLFELSVLRPIEQIGYLSKMSNTALEMIEKHYMRANLSGFFSKQLTAVTTTINADRKTRKISLMNLAISNPQRMAMLRLQKSKKKSIKTQANKKESIKRIKGMIH